MRRAAVAFVLALVAGACSGGSDGPDAERSATEPSAAGVQTSWLGNTFGGGVRSDPQSKWVQQDVNAIAVDRDGTVYTNSFWDEGTREAGSYRDGAPVVKMADLHGWNRGGGDAIAIDDTYAYVAMQQGHHPTIESPPPDETWFAYRRYEKSSGKTSPLPANAIGYDGTMRLVSTYAPVTGLAVDDSEIFAAVTDEDLVRVYAKQDHAELRSFSVPNVGHLALDADGNLWAVSGEEVRRYSRNGELQVTIGSVERPTSVAVANDGRLLVTSDGPRQQVVIFDVAGAPASAPREVGAIGEEGGQFAPPRGRAGPLRFNGLVGAATDAEGNVYTAASLGGSGTDIRKLAPSTEEQWQLLALAFIDTAAVDPESRDGTTVYTSRDRYRIDYDKPPGEQWTWEAHLVDRQAHPDDPRLSDRARDDVSPVVVSIEGTKLLFMTGADGQEPHFYRFERDDPDVTVQSTALPKNGVGWHVDARGNVWNANGETIVRYPFERFSADGDPEFGPPEETRAPSQFTRLQRVHYDAGSDTMFLAGWTSDNPKPDTPDTEKVVGTELARFDGWADGDRDLRWQVELPFEQKGDTKFYDETHRLRGEFVATGMFVAGDYVFTVQAADSKVRAYRTSDGTLATEWVPGAEVGKYVGIVDIPDPIRAFERPNGEYVVFVEDDALAKVLMYEWTPAKD